jgi:hypothetical protein
MLVKVRTSWPGKRPSGKSWKDIWWMVGNSEVIAQVPMKVAGSTGRCNTSSALIRHCFRGRTIGLAVLGESIAKAAFLVV